MPDERILNPGGTSAYGGAPYADGAEITGPPDPIVVTDEPAEFLGTDARSILIEMYPNHWNFIPNPSCRVDDSGWEVDGVVHTLNPDISWLGRSIAIPQGTASVRYRDLDSNSDPQYVYVGPSAAIEGPEGWTEAFRGGRGSSQWRFSTYLRGTGRVRLTMTAYSSSNPATYKAPPPGASAPIVADPDTIAFDENVPEVIDSATGRLWNQIPPAYYRKIGWVSVSADDPTTIGPSYSLPPELMQANDPQPYVYTLTSTTAPYYSLWGTASSTPDPATADPVDWSNDEYLRSSTDGSMWKLRESYAPHVPDPETGGVPPYHYYIPNSIKVVEDAINYEPDLSRIDEYLEYAGSLYERNGSATAPLYSLVSAITDAPITDLTDKSQLPEGELLPTTGDVVRRTGAEGDGSIWIVKGPPWYTDTNRVGGGFASVSTGWFTIDTPLEDDESGSDGWERHSVITNAATYTDGDRTSFGGCFWIDALIEVEATGTDGVLVSSVQLDPTEYPEAQYFDGDMAAESGRNDFMWLGTANDSESVYYYDREARTKWIQDNLRYLVPINRPYQIFYESTDRAYVPETNVTGTDSHGPSGMAL